MSDRQYIKHIYQFAIYRLVDADGLVERHIHNLIVFNSDHNVALSILEGLDRSDSQTARENTILRCRNTATLKMTKDGHASLEFRILMNEAVCIVLSSARAVLFALRHKHDRAILALTHSPADEGGQLVNIRLILRNDCCLCTSRNSGILCKKARIAPHNLHKEDAVMGIGCIANLVYTVHDGVEGRVIADGGVGAIQVVVNGSRQADTRDIVLRGYDLGAGKRAVSSDHDEGVDAVLLKVLKRLGTSLLIHEALASGCPEDGTSSVDRAADAFRRKVLDLVIDKAFPTPIYSFYLPSVIDGRPCHCSNRSVHSRCISSRSEDTYRIYPCHSELFFILLYNLCKFRVFSYFCEVFPIKTADMNIGNIELGDRPLFLAPMEDVTDASFRFICKEFGADMMYTEFISSDGLIRDARKSLEKLVTYDYEAPIGIQIYGNIPEAMVDAAVMAEKAAEIAGGHGADLVDINFGCPVSKIARRGAGSGMMREPDKMVEITRQVVEAVKLPVTVKTRLGWDEDSKIIVELAERLQDVGIQALTIHGRTRCQMYTGEADWTLIGKVKENPRMHIPIIGNGDINSPQKAKEYFDRYGVDAIMIGRATYGHPWIFKEIKHYLQTGEILPQMSVVDRVALAKRHLAKSLEIKGDRVGVLEMRRHLSCYFKGLHDFKETRLKLVTINDPAELFGTLDHIAEKWGGEDAPAAGNVYNV